MRAYSATVESEVMAQWSRVVEGVREAKRLRPASLLAPPHNMSLRHAAEPQAKRGALTGAAAAGSGAASGFDEAMRKYHHLSPQIIRELWP